MKLQSTVHDCLYLNWMLDPGTAPGLPEGLSYDCREIGGQERCFASLLLFRQRGLHWTPTPWLPLSHPQANLRLYVVDGAGSPAVVFLAIWVPGWMSGVMRSMTGVPATGARLRFPRAPVYPDLRGTWMIECGQRVVVTSRPGVIAGAKLGTWPQTVEFFRRRENGYVETGRGWRRVNAVQPDAEATPVSVTIEESDLTDKVMGEALSGADLQSAFLCEKLPFSFELSSAAVGVAAAG